MSNINPPVPRGFPSGAGRVSAGRRAPQLENLDTYNVNRAGQVEAIWSPLYDYQSYPAAGAQTLTFFQSPIGATRSLQDTNMELGGQLATPTEFLITSIGVNLLPGFALSSFGAGNANSQPYDVYTVLKSGVLRLTVGSKDYLKYAPLMEFPPASRLGGFAALSDASTAGSNLSNKIAYAQSNGPQFAITPIRLVSSQNFRVNLEFPNGAVALPSSNNYTQIGLILYGFLYRLSQ